MLLSSGEITPPCGTPCFPPALDEIVGRVESIAEEGQGRYLARISYSPDSVSDELPQLLNVIFGNTSIQKGVKVIDLELGSTLAVRFRGARFGIAGVRRLARRATGGRISPVIKPQGSNATTLAEIAYRCALAGAGIVKDDHGLTHQHMAPFKKRSLPSAPLVSAPRRRPANPRSPLHDHEPRPLQVLHKALGDDLGHDLVGVVLPLAAIEPKRKDKRRGQVRGIDQKHAFPNQGPRCGATRFVAPGEGDRSRSPDRASALAHAIDGDGHIERGLAHRCGRYGEVAGSGGGARQIDARHRRVCLPSATAETSPARQPQVGYRRSRRRWR